MKPEELPLLDIFNSLRQRYGLPLGVDEYLSVLQSLKAGVGISSRQELEQLCCLLWANSKDEMHLVLRLFEQMWQHLSTEVELGAARTPEGSEHVSDLPESTESKVPTAEPLIPNRSELPREPNSPETTPTTTSLPELDIPPSLTPEPVQAVKAVRTHRQARELRRPRYSLLTEYFPITRRQMKQSWRSLRRLIREGVPTELDLEATIAKLEREGTLLEPVLMPPRTNRTDLVLMIDQDGSMVPFHDLSRQLVETAERGGKLRQTHVFYFHDYPEDYLYRQSGLRDAQPLPEVLTEVGERALVLIVSDAGAARGYLNLERINYTQEWIKTLQKSVRYFAWLNPVPKEYWYGTTAGEIAKFVPMFEMSREGMNAAISVLRGKPIPGEAMYSWLM